MDLSGSAVVVLAGGSGGAKLAAGFGSLDVRLTVVANTGDDIEILGVHVSPDPDLCAYWLAGIIDEARGWGIAGDGFGVFERMVAMGAPDWFALSDLDLAACLQRRAMLDGGARQTDAQKALCRALGIPEAVLPMSDEPVRTRVDTPKGTLGFQEFMVREGCEPAIEGVDFEGIEQAVPTAEVLAALEAADLIVIGPSNPVISIGPILAVPGMHDALRAARAPVLAVSPFVGGRTLKGPTTKFMEAVALEPSTAGVVTAYGDLLDALVIDHADPPLETDLPSLVVPTLMDGARARIGLAEKVLEFAGGLP